MLSQLGRVGLQDFNIRSSWARLVEIPSMSAGE